MTSLSYVIYFMIVLSALMYIALLSSLTSDRYSIINQYQATSICYACHF